MIDFSKIYCNLHPHELITNFCTKDQCLLALCANCVCTHTQLHIDKGTAPEYENIRTTYKKVQESIRYQVELFEKDKERIVAVSQKVGEKRRKVKEIMDIAKEEVSLLLGNYFQEKEKNMMREIEGQEKKYGLHCENRLQSLNSYISRQVSNLISAAQQLSSNNFLQSLPRVRTQCLINSSKLHHEIESELQENQKFSTTISCNKGLLPNLIQVLEKAITVSFNGDSFHSRIKMDQGYIRPKSQGRIPENLGSERNVLMASGSGKQRNIQSQVNINFQGNSNKTLGETRKSSYLNQVPNFMNEIKSPEPLKTKISANPNQHLTTITPSYNFTSSSHPAYTNNQAYSLPLNMTSPNKVLNSSGSMEKMVPVSRFNDQQVFKGMDRPMSNGGYQPVSYVPSISDMIQGGRTLDRSTASNLNKKSKKIGLKLLTTTQTQPSMLQNIQNQRPWRQI